METSLKDPALEQIGEFLDHLPFPAIVTSPEHEILVRNDRFRADYRTGAVSSARTCHATIHDLPVPCDLRGETCPLRRCLDSSTPASAVHAHATPDGAVRQHVCAFSLGGSSGASRLGLILLHPPIQSVEGKTSPWPVGRSRPFVHALTLVRAAAMVDAPVLLLGERGTGKRLLARTIHRLGPRHLRPFVQLDASAFPGLGKWDSFVGSGDMPISPVPTWIALLTTLLAGGTLYLSEVTDLPWRAQTMLRALVDRSVAGAGTPRGEPGAGLRLICGSSVDLSRVVEQGLFRRDLFHRISAFPIHVPPLRDRMEDLPLLVSSLLEVLDPSRRVAIAPRTLAALGRLNYPGNVTQLRRILRSLCAGRPLPVSGSDESPR